MKSILTKKALAKAIERAMKAEYLVDTGAIGTVNLVLMEVDNIGFCDSWVVGSEEPIKDHVRFQAFGTKTSGEILVSNFGERKSVHLIGKGDEEHCTLLLVQCTGGVFTVVWNCDLPDKKSTFFMTATADILIIQLITLLAEKNFPNVNGEAVQRAVTQLMGGDFNE